MTWIESTGWSHLFSSGHAVMRDLVKMQQYLVKFSNSDYSTASKHSHRRKIAEQNLNCISDHFGRFKFRNILASRVRSLYSCRDQQKYKGLRACYNLVVLSQAGPPGVSTWLGVGVLWLLADKSVKLLRNSAVWAFTVGTSLKYGSHQVMEWLAASIFS